MGDDFAARDVAALSPPPRLTTRQLAAQAVEHPLPDVQLAGVENFLDPGSSVARTCASQPAHPSRLGPSIFVGAVARLFLLLFFSPLCGALSAPLAHRAPKETLSGAAPRLRLDVSAADFRTRLILLCERKK